jgi:uncharacterized protein
VKQWVVVALAIVLGSQAAPYRAEIEKARAARLDELQADDGWLTVTGLLWLKPGKNIAGSAPGSDLGLPAKAPGRLGVFELVNGQVTFTAEAGVTVMSAGARVRQSILDPGGGDKTALTIGDLRMFLIRREDRYAIRLRDINSPMRRGFKGLTYYPLNEAYRVDAAFVEYPEPHRIKIPNVLGQNPEMVSPGIVSFTLNGTEIRLEPVYETSEKKDLFFIFKDPTSQDTTYPAGRFLHTPLPQNGHVSIDFNLAYNPPCAFTDFATCPLPPRQNQTSVRIEAGEKAYHGVTR